MAKVKADNGLVDLARLLQAHQEIRHVFGRVRREAQDPLILKVKLPGDSEEAKSGRTGVPLRVLLVADDADRVLHVLAEHLHGSVLLVQRLVNALGVRR